MMVAIARSFTAEVFSQLFGGDDNSAGEGERSDPRRGPAAIFARELWLQRYQPLFAAGSPAAELLGLLDAARMCAAFKGTKRQLQAAARPLARVMAGLPEHVRAVEAMDMVDQLSLWLHQYNFLPVAQLHDFARSLFQCEEAMHAHGEGTPGSRAEQQQGASAGPGKTGKRKRKRKRKRTRKRAKRPRAKREL